MPEKSASAVCGSTYVSYSRCICSMISRRFGWFEEPDTPPDRRALLRLMRNSSAVSVNSPFVFRSSASSLTRAPSRPSTSKRKRSKLAAREMSVEGEDVAIVSLEGFGA